MVSNLLIDRLVNILREKDFNIAAQELENITDLDSFGSENFLHDIIITSRNLQPVGIQARRCPIYFCKGYLAKQQ